jgi:hypothetical protein
MASRDITTGIATALEASEIQPFFGVQLFLDSENLYFWTGLGDLTTGGITYAGTGQFLAISEMEETAEIAARGATITLSGIPSNLISLALTEPYQGRKCKIMFGAIDANRIYLKAEDGTYILREDSGRIDITEGDVTPVVELFTGYIDQMNIDEGPDTSTIVLAIESRLIDLERERIFRYTDQNQKARFPNDKGLEFVEDLQDKQFNWGRG